MKRGTLDPSAVQADASMREAPAVMPQGEIETRGTEQRGVLAVAPVRIVSSGLRNRTRWMVMSAVGTVLVHAGFAAFLLLLLDGRDLPDSPERAVPVEIVPSMPESRKPVPPPPEAPPPPGSDQVAATSPAPPPPFVAPPPEAAPAATQTQQQEPAVPSPSAPDKAAPAAPPPPPPAPRVLTAPEGRSAVPAPVREDPAAAPNPSAPDHMAASPTLAQALPLDLSAIPSTFLAVLSGAGTQAGRDYKGLVYGRIQRSHRAIEEARTRHLKGQVIVSFHVDARGLATDLKIAGSSGSPALDALGLAMVREAEPFPPPPPDADQVFTPAFSVGED